MHNSCERKMNSNLKYWNILSLLVLGCLITGDTCESVGENRGNTYSEDKLIGPDSLFNAGNPYVAMGNQNYTTTLLVSEGSYLRFSKKSGYFLGFHWYSSMTSQQINIQIFNPQAAGEYVLVKETDWIEAKMGYNLFYFDETLLIVENSVTDYIIGFTTSSNQSGPVLYQIGKCYTGVNEFVMHSSSNATLSVGDVIAFQSLNITPSDQCLTFSIQGIFVESKDAASTTRQCELVIAPEDREVLVFSHMPYPGNGYPQNHEKCYIIRAEYPDKVINIRNLIFDIVYNKVCFTDYLQLGDQPLLSDPNFNLWGSFCGKSPFGSRRTSYPYLKMFFDIGLSKSMVDNKLHGFIFAVQTVDGGLSRTQVILMAVLVPVAVVILLVIAAVVCVKMKKQQKTEAIVLNSK